MMKNIILVFLAVLVQFLSQTDSTPRSLLSPRLRVNDDVGAYDSEVSAMTTLGTSLGYKDWKENKGWMMDKSVCEWYGVKCESKGHVKEIDLKDNGLRGSIPSAIGSLLYLDVLKLNGNRPDNYVGCDGNNLLNNSIPPSLAKLRNLKELNLEYTCTAGTLDIVSELHSLTSLSLHGNYLHGTIPKALNALSDLTILKLGRNPITGTLPHFTSFSKMIQFNCNFCSLTGTFPDFFDTLPNIEVSYWDGNGFIGSLPSSIGNATKLTRLSFNINNFTGEVPPGICKIPAGDGSQSAGIDHDCRIGADTNLTAYQADYAWIQKVQGNMYSCDKMPACATHGSCNHSHGTAIVNPSSPLLCE
jgi:Leucine-rich repeat (LRR) protein